ncbi:MAG: ZIP family metal transporter [Patescibacteria group bacterium]|nr:ZIP family metal transporter [Patescibacteria group bacterium]MDD5295056.1 ZIP family metal transporter [Patescibacteria group bacterium]MDD5555030.1 ZIP family metal transporter [Patescibacteria group bacterium]
MGQIYLYTFLSVIIVSLISFIGALSLALNPEKLKKITIFFVSLSAGTLLGDSFIHLLPEMVKEKDYSSSAWLWVLGGIIVFFILEKIICWRHCHIPTSPEHPHHLGAMNLVGDGLHNFIDGLVIAGSFLINPPLGIATTLAVVAHEIPQEIGDFGVLIHAGYSRRKALFLNFLSALTAVLGAFIALLVGPQIENFSAFIIPFTAGGFIYIATADLIPELKKESRPWHSLSQLLSILIGVAIMLILKYWLE